MAWRISTVLALLVLAVPSLAAAEKPVPPAGADPLDEAFSIRFLHSGGALNWLDMDSSRGVPLIRLRVNDNEVCGLVDTGADRTVVDLDFASENGLAIIETGRTVSTIGDPIPILRTGKVTVEVPGQFVFEAGLFAIDIPDYDCPGGGRLSFVLGMEILQTMAVAFDPARARMLFTPSGKIAPRSDNFARIEWTGRTVSGTLDGSPARLMVDTGSNSLALISEERFDAYFDGRGEDLPGSAINASGRSQQAFGVRDANVSVGGLAAAGIAKRVGRGDDDADGRLGFPFFSTTFSILDLRRNLILMRTGDRPND